MGNENEAGQSNNAKKVNETWKLIQNRRSLRAYSSQPIDEDAKQKIITGAMRAPTGGNMMTYSILEVADP